MAGGATAGGGTAAGGALLRVAAFAHLPGREPAEAGDLPRWFGHLGALAARLHEQSRRFAAPAGFTRKRWDFDTILGPAAHWGDWRRAPLPPGGRAVLETAARRLRQDTAALGTGPDRFGLIHGDMRAANLLVEGGRLAVIDFDDCGFGWYGFEFAAAVSFIEDDPLLPALQAAWVAGYRSAGDLPAATQAALPMLVLLRRIQLTAWLASHAETPTALARPDFAAGTVALASAWLAGRPRKGPA